MRRRFADAPYNGFKDDRERRRALNARVRCAAAILIAWALMGCSTTAIVEKLQGLIRLWHHL